MEKKNTVPSSKVTPETRPEDQPDPKSTAEVGGRGGLDPTRYGDWEKGGRAIDF